MSPIQDLMKMEDTLKRKHMDSVKDISHVKLKKFTKGKCKDAVLKELKQLLPDFTTKQT